MNIKKNKIYKNSTKKTNKKTCPFSALPPTRLISSTIPTYKCFELQKYFISLSLIVLSLIISTGIIMSESCLLFAQDTKDPSQLFLEANQAYENGNFEKAAQLYKKVLDSGIKSGMIYYNLGNCYIKLGETGKALVYYRRAERLIPRDGDLRFNLNYVLDQRKDKIEAKEKTDLARVFFFWHHWLNLKELFYAFVVSNLIFWTLSLILIYKKNDFLKWIRLTAFILFLLFGASSGIKVYALKSIKHGAVISPEAIVRSGNGPNHSPLFILHEGAEFRIDEQTEGWMKISLADGKIGWISSASVETI